MSSAYYSTVRDLAARFPDGAPQCHQNDAVLADELQLSLDEQLQRPSALAADGASPWLQALTASLNNGTWMCLRGDCTPVATSRGTRPGSAWADLTFAVVIKRILALRDACRRARRGLCSVVEVPWDQCRHWGPQEDITMHIPLDDLVWADDLASCFDVDAASEAGRRVGQEAGILADAFASHALELAFGTRKTAAILSLRGNGARKAQKEIFGGKPEIPVLREHGGLIKLPIVDHYKHLGVLQSREGSIRAEIQQRKANAWVAFREGRTKLFRCRRISVARRGTLLNSLVMSKLLFGAGAWPPLCVAERKTFAGTVFALYRATLGLRAVDDQHISLATMSALLGLPDHDTLLKIEQLRYLRQLCGHAPDVVWALIRQDVPFVDLLREALAWLFARIRATSDLPDPLCSWQPWCELIQNRPNVFKGLTLRAKGLELCRATCFAALQALYQAMRAHGEGRPPAVSEQDPVIFPEACIPCRKAFATRAAWACHSSKLHGYRVVASVLAGSQGGKICLGCGKCFSKPARLRRHLLHTSSCRIGWGAFTPDPTQPVPDLHDCVPPVTIEGLLADCHFGLDPAAYNKGLLEALLGLLSPSVDSVWSTVSEFIEPLETLRETVRIWNSQTGGVHQDIADDVILLLDPDLLCDSFCKPKQQDVVADCFP